MHLTYPVLYALSDWMNREMTGNALKEAFTQEKDELILEFTNGYFLRIHCGPALQFVVPVTGFSRTTSNSVSLFPELRNKMILKVQMLQDDRVLQIYMEDQYCLWLKMFGNRSNILLSQDKQFLNAFLKKKGEEEWYQQAESQRQKVETTIPAWAQTPAFSVLPYPLNTESEREQFLSIACGAVWWHSDTQRPQLIWQEDGQFIQNALEKWLRAFLSREAFHLQFQAIHAALSQQLNYLKSSRTALAQAIYAMTHERDEEELGHILLANLHRIQPEDEVFSGEDPYTGTPVRIPLKKNLAPSGQAEWYYRKSRNRKSELARCQSQEQDILTRLPMVETALQKLEGIETIAGLREWKKVYGALVQEKKSGAAEEEKKPWKEFLIQDWMIRVGKDARSNDQLTLKGSKSGDIWLHVKDYSGSHVIIRQRSGKDIPESIIQTAAALAVWFSPRRGHELVAVSYCDRKFVRKNKKMPPGAVTLERFQTILVNSPVQLQDILS